MSRVAVAATHDALLRGLFAAELDALEAELPDGGAPGDLRRLRSLSSDLWALLGTGEWAGWPRLRATVPGPPAADRELAWSSEAGARRVAANRDLYVRVRERFAAHSAFALEDAWVLDLGCGAGRLTRLLARDVASGRLYACDSSAELVAGSVEAGVPATFAVRAADDPGLPFAGVEFDLAVAAPGFAALGGGAQAATLCALHAALVPGGLLVLSTALPDGPERLRGELAGRFQWLAADGPLVEDLGQVLLTLRRL